MNVSELDELVIKLESEINFLRAYPKELQQRLPSLYALLHKLRKAILTAVRDINENHKGTP